MKLNPTARATLAAAGVPVALWARANYATGDRPTWTGDVCGCPDNRCANGFHHISEDDCGCLPTLLELFLSGDGMLAPGVLPPIPRPGGGFYLPKRLAAEPLCDDGDVISGVIVLGTHNRDLAQPVADKLASNEADGRYRAVWSGGGWWRDGFESGERRWVADEMHGRAGVLFGRIEEFPVIRIPEVVDHA